MWEWTTLDVMGPMQEEAGLCSPRSVGVANLFQVLIFEECFLHLRDPFHSGCGRPLGQCAEHAQILQNGLTSGVKVKGLVCPKSRRLIQRQKKVK